MADDKKEVTKKKKTAGDDSLLLPWIVRYFKYAGVLLSIWLFGYTRFSPSWLLLGLVVFVWKERHTKRKHLQIQIQQQIAKDEQGTILARVEDLPSWVHFPDVERAEWINKMLNQIWPFIGDYVRNLLIESIQPKIQQSHSSVSGFKFTHIDLGDIPPRIGGVKVYTENVRRDEIYMDLEIVYSSDSNIEVKVKGLSMGIKDLQVHGTMRVILKPLIGKIPLFGGLSLFFINTPHIDFNLTGLANSLDLPGLSDMLDTIIAEQIANIMVLPNRIVVPMVENINLMMLRYPPPDGVLRMHVIEAKDLIKADIGFAKKGKSDPYTILKVAAKKFKTKVINDCVNPTWNETFEAIIDLKDGQYLDIELKDEDPGSKDDDLGNVSMDIESVSSTGTVDSWLPLEDVKSGLVHMKLVWMYLSKNMQALEQALQQSKRDGSSELASCILMVNLDSAKELPKAKKQMTEPNPYVALNIGQTNFESQVKLDTDSPRWEENFRFLIFDPNLQTLDLKVMDKKSSKCIGELSVPLKSVLTASDMTLDQNFSLKNSGASSVINMRLCLRVLTSDKSQATHDEGFITESQESSVDPSEASASASETSQTPKAKVEAEKEVPKQAAPTAKPAEVKVEKAEKVSTIPPASGKGSTPGTELRQRTSPSATSPVSRGNQYIKRENPKGRYEWGRLQLTLRYSMQRNCLSVVVHKCVNLRPCDKDELADPYIKMYLMPDKVKRKTEVIKNDLNPVFDETFEYPVKSQEVQGKVLDITIRNETTPIFGGKREMGNLKISLKHLSMSSATTEWFDVWPDDDDEDLKLEPVNLSSDV